MRSIDLGVSASIRPSWRPAAGGGAAWRRSRPARLVVALLAAALLSPARAGAVDALAETARVGPQAALDRDGALRLVETGKRAMADSNTTPARAVDAALAFIKAVHFFTTTGDTDLVCELNADIFWCKKRMNLDDLRGFLAAKGGDADDAKLIAEATTITSKAVEAGEAQAYFDRAAAYAQEHPTDYAQITVRYFEVAERFTGTPLSAQAQLLSLAAQKQLLEQARASQEALRATIFTHAVAEPAGARAAVPATEAVSAAVADLKKQYKEDYAKRRPGQRRHFAAFLVGAAADPGASPAMRYALFDEAASMALEGKDYQAVLATADAMAGAFTVDAKAQRLALLGREHGNPVLAAMIKLLDEPLDPDANTVVGKEFCFAERHWEEGIPVLARGNDATLKAVTDMELLKPEGPQQQIELADRWHDLAIKASGALREEQAARSAFWYGKAQPELKGVTKDRVAKRVEELGDMLPYTLYAYAAPLTVKQWERIPVKAVELSATSERQDTGIVLKRGMRIRIVPHPGEMWSFNYPHDHWWYQATKVKLPNKFDTDCWGFDPKAATGRVQGNTGGLTAIGATVMCIENGPSNLAGLLKGEEQAALVKYVDYAVEGSLSGLGRVFIGPHLPGDGKGAGHIRVKICVLDDE